MSMVETEKQIESFDQPNDLIRNITHNVEKVIIGKTDIVQMCLVAMLCNGHVLLEDVPGVGKTMLVRALAKSLGCSFKRIQFTPDLLPTDVTGVSIYNQKTMEFEFRPGPIMGNVILADEINRTSPKTQAALLETMEEGSITVDGVVHVLPKPFFIMATQNPIEYEGTFPLPEAQLDRFLLKLNLGYPEMEDEIDILTRLTEIHPIEDISSVMTSEQLLRLQNEVKQVHVDDSVKKYIVQITEATRKHPSVYLGASPRGSIALYRTAQALAFIRGRKFVVPDDVKNLVKITLAHRILLKSESRLSGTTVNSVLEGIINGVPVPVSRQTVGK